MACNRPGPCRRPSRWRVDAPCVSLREGSVLTALVRPRLDSISLDQRLAALPRDGLPLRQPVLVLWDEHQVPFIEADTDHDLAVTLGLVHVHLRWTQLELMRRVARGRLSELVGPFGVRLDRVLRTLDLGRAAPGIIAAWPAETLAWMQAFLAGINHAVRHLPQLPPEFRLLGLGREDWSLEDLLALSRLASADVTWGMWLALLPQRNQAEVAALWRRLVGSAVPLAPGGEPPAAGLRRFAAALGRFGRPGSNSWALGPGRTASGSAWIASDTHLPALLPNLWLVAGYRSPSHHVTGLMVPGIPAVMMGRNPWIAWGGTNLHATSSDLFDVSTLPAEAITLRRERLRVRFRGEQQIELRDTPLGPIISDLPQLRAAGGCYALRWMGHQPSDEISALLALNRAHDWAEFRAALDLIAVPGQNIIYADAAGHVGKAMAARLPQRPPQPPDALVLPAAAARQWQQTVRGTDLPAEFDPERGFVASANNRPPAAPVLIGHFFSADHRIERLRDVLGGAGGWDFAALAALQQDVVLVAAQSMRRRFARMLRDHGGRQAAQLARILDSWDGRYEADQPGPLVLELLLYYLGMALHGRRLLRLYSASWNTRGLLFEQVQALSPVALARVLRHAVPRTLRGWRKYRCWGQLHRLEPRHVMASVPLLGRLYRFGDWPAAGGSDTVMKTAHGPTDRRHRAGLASTARHISDLADPDANWFVLLGGQDGWIGSTTLLDQTRLWRRGQYLQVPLRPDSVRARFRRRTELRP